MSNVLRLHGDPHRETRELLPWLATDALAPGERVRIEAHLAICAGCRVEFGQERKIVGAIATLPHQAAVDWAAMRARIEDSHHRALHRPVPSILLSRRRRRFGEIGVFLGAQAALLAATVLITLRIAAPVAPYHALSSVPVAAAGNAVILFRPDAREQDIRALLRSNDARLVDGPTAANAYVLRIPMAKRDPALARLRSNSTVAAAEPLAVAASQ